MGRRKTEDRIPQSYRLAAASPEKLHQIALSLGYRWGKAGAVGKLLDAIANGEIILIAVSKNP